MPVLVTIAAVSYLFGGSKEKASFLNPAGLRKKIEKMPEGENRTQALALVDGLDMLAKEDDEATDATASPLPLRTMAIVIKNKKIFIQQGFLLQTSCSSLILSITSQSNLCHCNYIFWQYPCHKISR